MTRLRVQYLHSKGEMSRWEQTKDVEDESVLALFLCRWTTAVLQRFRQIRIRHTWTSCLTQTAAVAAPVPEGGYGFWKKRFKE